MEKKNKKMNLHTLDQVTDKFIGKKGTPEREKFDFELKMEIIGEMIKKTRLEKKLTQEELGELIGVKKAQISKIENNIKDVRFSTILKVFEALKAKVNLTVEFEKDSNLSVST